jgi:GNAT superfamily N-acetyltransferase
MAKAHMRQSVISGLYPRYLKEVDNLDVIETPEGFITFKAMAPDGAWYIRDIYVLPEHRKAGKAAELARQVESMAIAAGRDCIYGTVNLATNGYERNLRTWLGYGYELYSAHPGYLILRKCLSANAEPSAKDQP